MSLPPQLLAAWLQSTDGGEGSLGLPAGASGENNGSEGGTSISSDHRRIAREVAAWMDTDDDGEVSADDFEQFVHSEMGNLLTPEALITAGRRLQVPATCTRHFARLGLALPAGGCAEQPLETAGGGRARPPPPAEGCAPAERGWQRGLVDQPSRPGQCWAPWGG